MQKSSFIAIYISHTGVCCHHKCVSSFLAPSVWFFNVSSSTNSIYRHISILKKGQVWNECGRLRASQYTTTLHSWKNPNGFYLSSSLDITLSNKKRWSNLCGPFYTSCHNSQSSQIVRLQEKYDFKRWMSKSTYIGPSCQFTVKDIEWEKSQMTCDSCFPLCNSRTYTFFGSKRTHDFAFCFRFKRLEKI